MHLTIINGPNLNLLGSREPEIYGSTGFEGCLEALRVRYKQIQFEYFQSNDEGDLITILQNAANTDGIILNAGAYSHTSIALADAIAAIPTPVIEVHISNIYAREPFRHFSYLSAKCIGTITGLGLQSYRLAVDYFWQND